MTLNRLILHGDAIECPHGAPGKIVPKVSPVSAALKAGGRRVLLAEEVLDQPVLGCSTCQEQGAVVVSVLRCVQTPLFVDGSEPVAEDSVIFTTAGPAKVTRSGRHPLRLADSTHTSAPACTDADADQCRAPRPADGTIELIFVAFVSDNFPEWVPEPLTHQFDALYKASALALAATGNWQAAARQAKDCYWAEFLGDNRPFGQFDLAEPKARVYLRIVVPVARIGKLWNRDVTVESGGGVVRQRQHHTVLDRTNWKLTERIAEPDARTTTPDFDHSASESSISARTSVKYPFSMLMGDIDMKVELSFAERDGGMTLDVDFYHDRFPDYEMYVQGLPFKVRDARAAGETGPGWNLATSPNSNQMERDTYHLLLKGDRVRSVHLKGLAQPELKEALDEVGKEGQKLGELMEKEAKVWKHVEEEVRKHRKFVQEQVNAGKWTVRRGAIVSHRMARALAHQRRFPRTVLGQQWMQRVLSLGTYQERIKSITVELFHKRPFHTLIEVEKREVYARIVLGSEADWKAFARSHRGMHRIGQGLVLLGYVATIHSIYKSEDRVKAVGREAVEILAEKGGEAGLLLLLPEAPALLVVALAASLAAFSGWAFEWLLPPPKKLQKVDER